MKITKTTHLILLLIMSLLLALIVQVIIPGQIGAVDKAYLFGEIMGTVIIAFFVSWGVSALIAWRDKKKKISFFAMWGAFLIISILLILSKVLASKP